MWSYNDRGGETCQKPTLAMHGKARVKAQVGRWGTLSKKNNRKPTMLWPGLRPELRPGSRTKSRRNLSPESRPEVWPESKPKHRPERRLSSNNPHHVEA